MRRCVIVVSLAISSLVAPVAPRESASASPYADNFVTMVGHRGDWISQGVSRFFHPGNAAIGASWGNRRNTVAVGVNGGQYGEDFRFEFTAPAGEPLKVGDYEGAQRAAFAELGRPGIDISGEHRGCNEIAGRFTVKDIALDPRGRVARLWIVYQQNCEKTGPPLIGEIRYGMPGDGGDLAIGPASVRWPRLPAGGVAAVVPVRAVNTSSSSTSVSSVNLAGADEIDIRLDECSGRTLVSNESCAVWVRFAPSTQGTRTAELRIVEASGAAHVTSFEGEVAGTAEASPVPGVPGAPVSEGPTVFSYSSDEGDYIGQGEQRSYDPSTGDFGGFGGHHGVTGQMFLDNGEIWYADFVPPAGDILAPGFTYNEARRAAFAVGPAGLDVTGAGRGCNTIEGSFTVHALRVDDFGNLRAFSASFEQHCEGMEPALRGMFRWQHPGPFESLSPYPPPPPEPEAQTYTRRITLRIESRRAQGVVKMTDTVIRCRVDVPVRVQKRVEGVWRTVATTTTDAAARYSVRVGKKHGLYRAVAPQKVLVNGDVCTRAVSARWRY